MSCVIFDSWLFSLSETVNTTRLNLIYEGGRGLTSGLKFSKQFICSFKATLDPS